MSEMSGEILYEWAKRNLVCEECEPFWATRFKGESISERKEFQDSEILYELQSKNSQNFTKQTTFIIIILWKT